MTVNVAPVPPVGAFLDSVDLTGNILAGGSIKTFLAGTTTPLATYSDPSGNTPNSTIIDLDNNSLPETNGIYLDVTKSYKFVWFDAQGNQVNVRDNIAGNPYPAQIITPYTPGTDIDITDFVVSLNYPRTDAEVNATVTPINYNYLPYTLLRYGADPTGATDSTTALQNAINCAQEANYSMVTVGVPGALLKIGSAWTIDTNKTGIDFQGAYINASSFVTGHWLTPTQSATDVNQRPTLNAAHPIQNAIMQGPGIQNAVTNAVYMVDSASTPTIAGVIFKNIGFQDWGQDVIFDNGSFCTIFDSCTFNVTIAGSTSPATTYSITQLNGNNTGERNVFINCSFYNKQFICQNAGPGADLYFQNCSLDGFNVLFLSSGGSSIYADNCHIESNTDVAYWIMAGAALTLLAPPSGTSSTLVSNWTGSTGAYNIIFSDSQVKTVTLTNGATTATWTGALTGSPTVNISIVGINSVVSITGGCIIVDSNKPSFAICYSDNTISNGGIYLDNVNFIFGGKTISQPICAGAGVFEIKTPHFGRDDTRPLLGSFLNRFTYPLFDSSNYTSDWTLVNSARTNSTAPPGSTWSLAFNAAMSTNASASRQISCKAGDWLNGSLYYYFPGSISGTFIGQIGFTDAGGNPLNGATIFSTTTTVGTWTQVEFGLQIQAPPGTVFGELSFSLSGASGTSVGYIGNVQFFIY